MNMFITQMNKEWNGEFLVTLREYYNSIGISNEVLESVNKELTIGNIDSKEMINSSTQIKREMMLEAEKTTYKHDFIETKIHKSRRENPDDINKWIGKLEIYYSEGDTIVGAIKPGKEAAIDYKLNHYKKCKCDNCKDNGKKPTTGENRLPNMHDMLPVIIRNDRNLATKITFERNKGEKKVADVKRYTPWTLDQICRPLEYLFCQKYGRFGLELFGTLLFRSAFNMDHKMENGKWRLTIPSNSLGTIERVLPNKKMKFTDGDVPVEFTVSSLFYFFDILGINEDIKVHAKGRVSDFMEPTTWKQYEDNKNPTKIVINGRSNTLLTYCQIIAIMLSRDSVGSGMIGYQRGMGMYPMNISNALDYFPLLSPNLHQLLDKEINMDLHWIHGPI